ncbi:hypothetical protein GGR57DRAFT_496411 [Xylariaceae sp. FL1272]|nr:hypothetical protein GGR57DRAFT_496411 [Xylariaceae sp. FL1272]
MKRSREPEENGDGPDETRSEQTGSAPKITDLDTSAIDSSSDIVMRCSLPPHREVLCFTTYDDYATHYSKAHTDLLNIHFEDIHDAFAAVKREKGDHTYSCFVQGCDRKCRTPYKRRSHLIDKHMYPPNYFFAVTKDGIDGRQSLLASIERSYASYVFVYIHGGHRRRRSSTATTTTSISKALQPKEKTGQPEGRGVNDQRAQQSVSSGEAKTQAAAPDVDMEGLAGAMSALQFVPHSVKFGRGRGKAGFARR